MDPLAFLTILVFVAALLWDRRQQRHERETTTDKLIEAMAAQGRLHAHERRELANRIQHPHLIPHTAKTNGADRERPTDHAALGQIGRVAPLRTDPPPEG